MQRRCSRAFDRFCREVLRECDAEWLKRVLLRKRRMVKKRHPNLDLNLRQSWKVILFVLLLCAIGCLLAAYLVLNFD
jgi:hypothetical protein